MGWIVNILHWANIAKCTRFRSRSGCYCGLLVHIHWYCTPFLNYIVRIQGRSCLFYLITEADLVSVTQKVPLYHATAGLYITKTRGTRYSLQLQAPAGRKCDVKGT
jgi:hypothetical protein